MTSPGKAVPARPRVGREWPDRHQQVVTSGTRQPPELAHCRRSFGQRWPMRRGQLTNLSSVPVNIDPTRPAVTAALTPCDHHDSRAARLPSAARRRAATQDSRRPGRLSYGARLARQQRVRSVRWQCIRRGRCRRHCVRTPRTPPKTPAPGRHRRVSDSGPPLPCALRQQPAQVGRIAQLPRHVVQPPYCLRLVPAEPDTRWQSTLLGAQHPRAAARCLHAQCMSQW